MAEYQPKPEHKFTFDPIQCRSRDPIPPGRDQPGCPLHIWLLRQVFRRKKISSRGFRYECLDQLTIDIITGIR